MSIPTVAAFSGLRCRLILPVLTAALPGVWFAVHVTGQTPPTGSAALVLAVSALATAVTQFPCRCSAGLAAPRDERPGKGRATRLWNPRARRADGARPPP